MAYRMMCQGTLSLLSLLVLTCVTAAVYAESKCPWILTMLTA